MRKSLLSAALATPMALAGSPDAVHIVRSGQVHVDAPPQLAFPLFSGPGEELWIDDWDPAVLSGDGLERGSVFVTEIGEKTFWIVIEFDRESLHARYARVAPESRAGTVEVRVKSDGAGGSIATVTYELTGLSEEGNAMLAEQSDEDFTDMLTAWENMIRDADIDYEQELFARQ